MTANSQTYEAATYVAAQIASTYANPTLATGNSTQLARDLAGLLKTLAAERNTNFSGALTAVQQDPRVAEHNQPTGVNQTAVKGFLSLQDD